ILTITPAALSVTAYDASRVYAQTNPVFSGALSGVQNGDNLTATYTSSATTNSPVGTYAIVPGFSDPDGKLPNYTVYATNGTLTVTPALLTGTVDNKSRPYGQPDPVFTVHYTGFVNEEDEGVLLGDFVGTTTATAFSPVGVYSISGSGQTATNYTVSYVDGALT